MPLTRDEGHAPATVETITNLGRQGSPDQDRGRPASTDHRRPALARLHCRPSPDDRSGRHVNDQIPFPH